MAKVFVQIITGMLILISLAASPAATDAGDPEEQWIVVDPRTQEIFTLPVDGSGSTDSLQSCGGDAPDTTYCETGEHETIWLHGFPSPFPEAATLESRIIHENGAQIFRCTYGLGENLDNCSVAGELAPPEGPYYHDCFAYLPLTGGLIPGSPGPDEPTGVPGGLGSWECLIVE